MLQSVLCLEVCKDETQEQVVSALASFIEENAYTLGSGWKPLFSALKAVRPGSTDGSASESDVDSRSRLNLSLIDVFKKYITNDDLSVVLGTMVDFINCLLHYIETSPSFGQFPLIVSKQL